MAVAPDAVFVLPGIALIVLLLGGGLVAMIAHGRTRAAGTAIAIFLSIAVVAATFVGYSKTAVQQGAITTVISDEHGRILEMRSDGSSTPQHNSYTAYSYAQYAPANLSAAPWAKLMVVVVMVSLVALLTSGEKARGMTVRALGTLSLIVGGAAVLYFLRSMPSDLNMAATPYSPMPPVQDIPEQRPVAPPAPVPPAAEHEASSQTVPTEQPGTQTAPTAPVEAAATSDQAKTETPTEIPAASPEATHEHASDDNVIETPANPVPETPASAPAATDAQTPASSTSTNPLTVAEPSPTKTAEAKVIQRPEWVDQPPRRVGSEYFTHASSGLFSTVEECERALEGAAIRAVQEYAALYLGDEDAARRIPIDQNFISRLQRGPVYEEHNDRSVGRMVGLHKQLVIDDAARNEIRARWEAVVRGGRLWYLGCGAVLVLSLVGTLFSYLKLDLITGGTYRGRLQLAAAAAILVAAAAALIVS